MLRGVRPERGGDEARVVRADGVVDEPAAAVAERQVRAARAAGRGAPRRRRSGRARASSASAASPIAARISTRAASSTVQAWTSLVVGVRVERAAARPCGPTAGKRARTAVGSAATAASVSRTHSAPSGVAVSSSACRSSSRVMTCSPPRSRGCAGPRSPAARSRARRGRGGRARPPRDLRTRSRPARSRRRRVSSSPSPNIRCSCTPRTMSSTWTWTSRSAPRLTHTSTGSGSRQTQWPRSSVRPSASGWPSRRSSVSKSTRRSTNMPGSGSKPSRTSRRSAWRDDARDALEQPVPRGAGLHAGRHGARPERDDGRLELHGDVDRARELAHAALAALGEQRRVVLAARVEREARAGLHDAG